MVTVRTQQVTGATAPQLKIVWLYTNVPWFLHTKTKKAHHGFCHESKIKVFFLDKALVSKRSLYIEVVGLSSPWLNYHADGITIAKSFWKPMPIMGIR